MMKFALFPKGLVPDIFLYNSDQSHYDLLVSEDRKLAQLGLVEFRRSEEEQEENVENSNEWKVKKTK